MCEHKFVQFIQIQKSVKNSVHVPRYLVIQINASYSGELLIFPTFTCNSKYVCFHINSKRPWIKFQQSLGFPVVSNKTYHITLHGGKSPCSLDP